MGTNCLVVFLELRIPFHGDAFAAMQTGASETTREMRDRLMQLLGEAGVAEPVRDSGAFHYLGEVIYAQASTLGFQDAYFLLALIAIVGLIPGWVLARASKGQR